MYFDVNFKFQSTCNIYVKMLHWIKCHYFIGMHENNIWIMPLIEIPIQGLKCFGILTWSQKPFSEMVLKNKSISREAKKNSCPFKFAEMCFFYFTSIFGSNMQHHPTREWLQNIDTNEEQNPPFSFGSFFMRVCSLMLKTQRRQNRLGCQWLEVTVRVVVEGVIGD